jgi:hypothetical protein
MTHAKGVPHRGAGGGARPDDRIEPDPLPFPPGDPPPEVWCEYGTPPDGFLWLGAKATVRCWLYPCPACCAGWVPLVPSSADERDYELGPIGCSRGCEHEAVARWHRLKTRRHEPFQPDERERRYARRVIESRLSEASEKPRRTAIACGQWCASAGFAPPILLATVADAAGVDPAIILDPFMDGLAAPARPRLSP